jgi:hypothetical protein
VTQVWITDDELRAARERLAAGIPGYVDPAAYGAARMDGGELTFGYVNPPGGEHRLPAAVLATVAGYVDRTSVVPLDREHFTAAIDLLAPAEAATHWEHPNLWSWRELLAGAGPDSTYLAFFVADADDPPVSAEDAAFRERWS